MDDREEYERRVGTTLRGKWTLEKLIGVGGMAAVYVGLHGIGRRDAIKILHAHFAKDRDLRKRFEREAQAANRFHHPGAVEILDMDIADDGAPFLVMELLEGESLGARADRGPLPNEEVLRYVDELLDVLAAAHAQGIIHRDIKPDNLFISNSGRLKVLDFGIARMRQGAVSSLYTKAGALLGTLSYMPPEQILGEAIDARADLFAVGATMFRLIARRRLHEAVSESDMVVKMATQPVPKICSVAPAVPRAVGLVVDRALAFAKEQRYPDALTMQADVRAVLAGQEPPYAARLAAMGDDPGAGAPSAERPPPSVLTRAAPPGYAADAAAASGDAPTIAFAAVNPDAIGPPVSVRAASAVTAVVGAPPGSVPRAAPSQASWAGPRQKGEKLHLPPWLWIAGGAAVLVILGAVIGFSCSGRSEPGVDEVTPRIHPRPIHPRPRQQPRRRHEDE